MVPGDLGLGWDMDQTSSEKCRGTKSHRQRQPHPSSYPTMVPWDRAELQTLPRSSRTSLHPG